MMESCHWSVVDRAHSSQHKSSVLKDLRYFVRTHDHRKHPHDDTAIMATNGVHNRCRAEYGGFVE
jgi:hypothetical protein